MKMKQIIKLVASVLLAIVVLTTISSIFDSVPSGYTGILTTYGKVEDQFLPAGFHAKLPWQKIVKLDNHVQTMRIASGVDKATTKDTAETKDQQLIPAFEFEIQYQLNQKMSFMVYSDFGENYKDALITANCLQFIKETFASFNADEIVSNKNTIPQTIKEKLAAVTEPMGVNIIRVNMVTYDFSPEYTALLEQRALLNAQLENNQLQQQNERIAAQTQYDVAVKEAERDAETKRIAAENENSIAIAKAEAKATTDKINAENEAYVKRTKADAERDARIAVAEAEKAELEARASGLNDYVIQQAFIEKWDGKFVPSFGDTGIGFTNYTDIINKYLGINDDEE